MASEPPVFARKVFTGTGSVEVAVWEKKSAERTVYSVTVRRTWRNDEGKWHSSETLRPEDVLPAAQFLQQAFLFLVEQNGKK